MHSWVLAYQCARAVKWLLWVGFFGFSLYFVYNRAPYLTQFGHLTLEADIYMFGLPLAAVAVGFMELMLRDYAYPSKTLAKRET
jgi:hypothetical protein